MANSIDIKLELPTDAELAAMFDAVPVLERYKVGDKVTRAGGAVIVKRARQLAPRSDRTGSVKRWSKKMYEDGGTGGTPRKQNEMPLWKTIAQVVRTYGKGQAFTVVGPKWPEGSKAYFNTGPDGRRKFLWGKDTETTVPAIRNWIVQAFDETKDRQLSAMKAKLKTLMDEIWKRKHG